jgi:hypothetical protein
MRKGIYWTLRAPINKFFNLKLKAELPVKMGERFPDFSTGSGMPSVLNTEFCICGDFDLNCPWGSVLRENCTKTEQKQAATNPYGSPDLSGHSAFPMLQWAAA